MVSGVDCEADSLVVVCWRLRARTGFNLAYLPAVVRVIDGWSILPFMDRRARKLISVTIGVVAFAGSILFLFPSGCADVDGMSSWERCTTAIGTPAFSLTDWWGLNNQFDILIPLVVGFLAAVVTWWLLGLRNRDSPS